MSEQDNMQEMNTMELVDGLVVEKILKANEIQALTGKAPIPDVDFWEAVAKQFS